MNRIYKLLFLFTFSHIFLELAFLLFVLVHLILLSVKCPAYFSVFVFFFLSFLQYTFTLLILLSLYLLSLKHSQTISNPLNFIIYFPYSLHIPFLWNHTIYIYFYSYFNFFCFIFTIFSSAFFHFLCLLFIFSKLSSSRTMSSTNMFHGTSPCTLFIIFSITKKNK